MEADFDLDNMIDSINLTGQWQPSTMPHVSDSSLNSQILDDILLGADGLEHSSSTNSDEIHNALIDIPMDPFEDLAVLGSSLDIDEITKLFSSPIEETPRQSTIEDSMDRMNINPIRTDILSSSMSIPMGSSPVEQKEIDNSILARKIVRNQQRLYKNASRSNKRYQQSSSTVGPIDVLSTYEGFQSCTTAQLQNDTNYQQQVLQFDTMESKKILIKSQPRTNFRPRTQNESKNAAHYIRCEPNSEDEYPTIFIPLQWAFQSEKNIIEVTLVAMDKQLHAYSLENKYCKNSFDEDALIFRENEFQTLYFCLTEDDFKKGSKSFMVEYIKSKQDETITKDVIKTRQLEQSMLRFTRFYQAEKHTYQRDNSSIEYSSVMNEAYGDVAVEHMGPPYGPMGGNERVYILLKGRVLKDDITVFVTQEEIGWRQQVLFTKVGNLVHFSMPAFPYPQCGRVVVNIIVYYKGEELYQSVYAYKQSLDEELAALNLSDPISTTFDALDFFSATGARPVMSSSKKSSTTKRPKRLNDK